MTEPQNKIPVISAPVTVVNESDPALQHNPDQSSVRKVSHFPVTNIPTENMPSTTTVEQNLHSAGQRKINYIWEYTQAAIALVTVIANIAYIFLLVTIVNLPPAAATASGLLANAFFLVIGFYFGRTNHARVGDTARDALN